MGLCAVLGLGVSLDVVLALILGVSLGLDLVLVFWSRMVIMLATLRAYLLFTHQNFLPSS